MITDASSVTSLNPGCETKFKQLSLDSSRSSPRGMPGHSDQFWICIRPIDLRQSSTVRGSAICYQPSLQYSIYADPVRDAEPAFG